MTLSERIERPRIIAHRGARALAPENTLEAIAKAAEAGADAVELDLQISADGRLVVFHDDELTRTTDVAARFPERSERPLAEFRFAELRALDAGSWYVEQLAKPAPEREEFLRSLSRDEEERFVRPADRDRYRSGEVRIPELAEAIAECERFGLELHLELKAIPRLWPDLAEAAAREVVRLGAAERTIASSFDHQQLARVRAVAPAIRTAVLTSDRLYRPAEYLRVLGASAYNPGCYGDYDTIGFASAEATLDGATVSEVLTAGFAVNVWTANDPARLAALLDLGVSGIFTDYPHRLRELLDARPLRLDRA